MKWYVASQSDDKESMKKRGEEWKHNQNVLIRKPQYV